MLKQTHSTDIYRFWSKKKLKTEIAKLKIYYNELFDSFVNLQKQNKKLKKRIEELEKQLVH